VSLLLSLPASTHGSVYQARQALRWLDAEGQEKGGKAWKEAEQNKEKDGADNNDAEEEEEEEGEREEKLNIRCILKRRRGGIARLLGWFSSMCVCFGLCVFFRGTTLTSENKENERQDKEQVEGEDAGRSVRLGAD
jgi:hypothetical protein